MSQLNTKFRSDTRLGWGGNDENEIFEGGDDDFSDYFHRGEEDEGRRLAMEFYHELRHRHRGSDKPLHESGDENNDNDGGGGGTTHSKNNDAAGVRSRSSSVVQAFANRPDTSSSSRGSSSSPFSLFPLRSLFPPNVQRPATSAGLFSGSGTTVYSSGRSIRAEIEILETSFKNNDNDDDGDWRRWIYVGNAEHHDDAMRLIVLSLIVLSTVYVAVEITGAIGGGMGMEIMTWNGAAASANRVMAIMNDGVSDVVIGFGGGGDVFVGEEAAWLLRESSEFAAIVVDAVRTVEQFGSQLVR